VIRIVQYTRGSFPLILWFEESTAPWGAKQGVFELRRAWITAKIMFWPPLNNFEDLWRKKTSPEGVILKDTWYHNISCVVTIKLRVEHLMKKYAQFTLVLAGVKMLEYSRQSLVRLRLGSFFTPCYARDFSFQKVLRILSEIASKHINVIQGPALHTRALQATSSSHKKNYTRACSVFLRVFQN